MSEYQDLIIKVIKNIKEGRDITYLISTQDQHTAMISTKNGEISYLRYGSQFGVEALHAFSNMKIKSVQERQHPLEHSKVQNTLLRTDMTIRKLCINFPEFLHRNGPIQEILEDYFRNSYSLSSSARSSKAVGLVPQSRERRSGAVFPIEPRSADISDSMIQTVKAALQQSVGPIFDLIYQDVFSEIVQLKTRKDLALLINLLINEIDEDQYRNQFIHSVYEQLSNVIVIQDFK